MKLILLFLAIIIITQIISETQNQNINNKFKDNICNSNKKKILEYCKNFNKSNKLKVAVIFLNCNLINLNKKPIKFNRKNLKNIKKYRKIIISYLQYAENYCNFNNNIILETVLLNINKKINKDILILDKKFNNNLKKYKKISNYQDQIKNALSYNIKNSKVKVKNFKLYYKNDDIDNTSLLTNYKLRNNILYILKLIYYIYNNFISKLVILFIINIMFEKYIIRNTILFKFLIIINLTIFIYYLNIKYKKIISLYYLNYVIILINNNYPIIILFYAFVLLTKISLYVTSINK